MANAPNDRRRQLLSLRRRTRRQLRALDSIRAEVHEVNCDPFARPVAADDHPWLLAIEPTRRELTVILAHVEEKLAGGIGE